MLCLHRRTKEGPIIGVHLIGDRVGELITEGQLAVGWEAHPEDIAPFVHAHPTQSEALGVAHVHVSLSHDEAADAAMAVVVAFYVDGHPASSSSSSASASTPTTRDDRVRAIRYATDAVLDDASSRWTRSPDGGETASRSCILPRVAPQPARARVAPRRARELSVASPLNP